MPNNLSSVVSPYGYSDQVDTRRVAPAAGRFTSGLQSNVAPMRRATRRAVEDVRNAGFLAAKANAGAAGPVAPMFTRPPPTSNGISANVLKGAPIPDGKFSYTTDGSSRSDWKRIGQDLADGADPNAIPAINVTGFARSSTGDGPAGMQQWNAEDQARRQWQSEQVAARGGVPLGVQMPGADVANVSTPMAPWSDADSGRLMAAANAKRLRADLELAPYMGGNHIQNRDIAQTNANNAMTIAQGNASAGVAEIDQLRDENKRLMQLIDDLQRGRSLDQADTRLAQNDQRLTQNQQRIDNAGTRSGKVGPPAPTQPSAQPQQQQPTGQQPYTFTRRTQPTAGRVPPGATSNGDGTIVLNGATYRRGVNAAGQSGWERVN